MANHTSKPKQLATIGEGAKFKPVGQRGRETFSQALKRMNKEHGITHVDLGKMCSVPPAVVKAWEDDLTMPTRSEFGKICRRHRQLRFNPPVQFLVPKVEVPEEEERIDLIPPVELPAGLPPLKTFGESLRREREAEGLTQEELGDALGVTNAAVSQWESGKRDPDLETLEKLADLFPRLIQGPVPEVLEKAFQALKAREEAREELPEKRTHERIGMVRQIARMFLDDATTPEQRQARLEALRTELPRRDRRAMGIPSPDAVPPSRPSRPEEPEFKKCPRCHEEVADLVAHRELCSKKREKPTPTPVLPMPRSVERRVLFEKTGEVLGPGSGSEELVAEQVALQAPSDVAPQAPSDGVVKAFELVERCIVLADMLWPDTRHAFLLEPGTEKGWMASVCASDKGRPINVKKQGGAETPPLAVRALADALRAEVGERQRRVADLAKLLED